MTRSGFDSTGRLRPVFDLIERFVSEEQVDGAAVAVGWHGQRVGEHYAGRATAFRPAEADTLWPLASISKLYTASVVMALVERGELTLGMTVCSVLPTFEGGGKEQVTMRHLLTHTSGMIYESPEMEQRLIDQTPIAALIDEAYNYPLQFPPGSRFFYSDYNYALAGRVASAVTGKPFPDLVRDLVLQPAGLVDTFMPPPPSEYPRLAHVAGTMAYGTPGDMYNSPYALDLAHPAFGTVSTVGDLLRFGLLFAPGGGSRIFSEAAIRTMTTDQTGRRVTGAISGFSDDAPRPWGIGFAVRGATGLAGDLLSPESYGHGGATGCTLQIDPLEGIVVAYVSNRHARTGREPFTRRQVSVVNMVTAALTRQ